MGLHSGLAPNAVKTSFDLLFNSRFNYDTLPGTATARTAAIFQPSTMDKAQIITEQYMGSGYYETKAELQNVPEGTVRVGNQKAFSAIKYAKAIPISDTFFDDDQHDVVSRTMKNEGRLARISQDKNCFNVLNNGFTTELANDGVALFSNSHITLGGDTVDNLETAALSETSLNTLILSLMAQKTQDGTLGAFEAATLVVPDALWKLAKEITGSLLRSGTINNDMNYYSDVFPGLQVYRSSFLNAAQGGSATAYFLFGQDHSLYRWVRKDLKTSLIPPDTSINDSYIYKVNYREAVGAISYEGMVASNGTA